MWLGKRSLRKIVSVSDLNNTSLRLRQWEKDARKCTNIYTYTHPELIAYLKWD